MHRILSAWILLLGCAILPPGTLWAQVPLFFDDIGCGPRAIALGQAFTAVADDPSAAYYNPAGLTQTPSHFVLSVGYQYSKPKIHIRVLDKDGIPYVQPPLLEQREVSRSEDMSTRGLWLGMASNFSHVSAFQYLPSFIRNFAFGFVMFYGLPETITWWNPQRKQDPYHLRYNSGYSQISMALSLSYPITDYLSVGAGVIPRMDVFQDTSGNYIEADKYLEAVLNPSATDTGFRLRLKTQAKLRAEWIFGILFRPPVQGLKEKLSIGVAYRREISGYVGTGYSSDPLVLIDDQGNMTLLLPLNARSIDYIAYTPAQVSAGLALRLFPGMTLSADITWKDYSKFKFFWALPPEPRFKDTWIPRVGLEYFFDPNFEARFLKSIEKIRFQGGYYYEPSPVPDMNGQMNILDSDMNVISVGTGVDCRLEVVDLLQVQAYFQLHLAEERHLHNERDLIFGSIWSGGEVYGAGISLTIHL